MAKKLSNKKEVHSQDGKIARWQNRSII